MSMRTHKTTEKLEAIVTTGRIRLVKKGQEGGGRWIGRGGGQEKEEEEEGGEGGATAAEDEDIGSFEH